MGSFKLLVDAFIAEAKARAANGISFEDIGNTFVEFIQLCVSAADKLVGIAGPEKKKLVMDAVTALWVTLEPFFPLPVTTKLAWLFVKYTVQRVALAIASAVVEAVLDKLRKKQTNLEKEPVVQ